MRMAKGDSSGQQFGLQFLGSAWSKMAHVIWALPRDRRLSHLCQVSSTLCRTLAMERLLPMIP